MPTRRSLHQVEYLHQYSLSTKGTTNATLLAGEQLVSLLFFRARGDSSFFWCLPACVFNPSFTAAIPAGLTEKVEDGAPGAALGWHARSCDGRVAARGARQATAGAGRSALLRPWRGGRRARRPAAHETPTAACASADAAAISRASGENQKFPLIFPFFFFFFPEAACPKISTASTRAAWLRFAGQNGHPRPSNTCGGACYLRDWRISLPHRVPWAARRE